MNKRGFMATLAAMCMAPFAAKADPIEDEDEIRLRWINLIQRSANEAGATINRWENWNLSHDGRRMVGMCAYGVRDGRPYTPGFATVIDKQAEISA